MKTKWMRHETLEEKGGSVPTSGERFKMQVCWGGAMSLKSVQMWRTGVSYELVGVPEGKKKKKNRHQ